MKNYILSILMISAISGIYGQNKNFLDQAYLETNATVDTLVVPDRIYLSVLIQESDTKDRTSVEELENRMKSKLEALGLDTEKQLFLADLGSNFKDYFLRKTGVLKSKAYTILTYTALSAGEVIQGLESIGISNIQFQNAELSELDQLELALRKQAVRQARKQAQSMLEPLGQSLGKALYISDLNTGIMYDQPRAYAMEMSAKAEMDSPIDVDFQKIKVSSTVNVKFSID